MQVQKTKLQINNQKKVSFKAGLTVRTCQEMLQADVAQISQKIKRQGIDCDFKGNSVIAWCSYKTIQIVRELNRRFGLKLDLPRGVYADNFERLNVEDKNMYGFCNFAPFVLGKDSDIVAQQQTVFFNTKHDWTQIDSLADQRYSTGDISTNHFLYPILHEFSHVEHEGHLLTIYDGESLVKIIEELYTPEQIALYQRKYGRIINLICKYALKNPLEAVACDVSRVIANVLDSQTFMPMRNPFLDTPYQRPSFWQRRKSPKTPEKERMLDGILRNFWNGNFE